MFRQDPGPCLVCGTAHCACSDTQGPILVQQLPASGTQPLAPARLGLEAERVQDTLPPGQFTTGTYRRPKKRSAA